MLSPGVQKTQHTHRHAPHTDAHTHTDTHTPCHTEAREGEQPRRSLSALSGFGKVAHSFKHRCLFQTRLKIMRKRLRYTKGIKIGCTGHLRHWRPAGEPARPAAGGCPLSPAPRGRGCSHRHLRGIAHAPPYTPRRPCPAPSACGSVLCVRRRVVPGNSVSPGACPSESYIDVCP